MCRAARSCLGSRARFRLGRLSAKALPFPVRACHRHGGCELLLPELVRLVCTRTTTTQHASAPGQDVAPGLDLRT